MVNVFARYPSVGWTIAIMGLFAFVLIPFFLWEDLMASTTDAILVQQGEGLTMCAIVVLLALDMVLPVPSSLVCTFSGFFMGLVLGTVVSWAGLMLGCVIGYGLGRFGGYHLALKLVGECELARAEQATRTYGVGAVVVCRSVPVLAEASVIFVGMSQMAFGRFLAASALSNFGVAVVYAAIGQSAAGIQSFLLVFLGAILVPWLAMGALRLTRRFSSPSPFDT